jgi:phosphatidylserine/phosphatidylglycerophosphate/cardiolipin synthase-like enzyme
VSHYDNRDGSLVDWIDESVDGERLRVATGFVDLGGLQTLTRAVPEDTSVEVLTGTALRGRGGAGKYLDVFGSDLEDEGSTESVREVYDQLRHSVRIRGISSLHAKVFLQEDGGLVGSSNLTHSGLHSPLEYNTELTNEQYAEADEWFDRLWDEGEELTDEFVERIEDSEHGVMVADVPITDPDKFERVTDIDEAVSHEVASRSLARQIARLDDVVCFFGTTNTNNRYFPAVA